MVSRARGGLPPLSEAVHRIAIFYPCDPVAFVPSGIDTFIRGILKWAPADLEYTLFGATADARYPTDRERNPHCGIAPRKPVPATGHRRPVGAALAGTADAALHVAAQPATGARCAGGIRHSRLPSPGTGRGIAGRTTADECVSSPGHVRHPRQAERHQVATCPLAVRACRRSTVSPRRACFLRPAERG